MVESLMVESLVCSRAVIRVAKTAVAAALGAETAAAAVLVVATAAAVHLAGTAAAAGPSFLVAAVAALLPRHLRCAYGWDKKGSCDSHLIRRT